jgi:hypothetical protein
VTRDTQGNYHCDGPGCGRDVGNGGIGVCASVVDVDPTTGGQRHRHLCYPDGENPGCRDLLLGSLA